MGLPTIEDYDLVFGRPELVSKAQAFGIDFEQLAVAKRVFGNLIKAELDVQRFLLHYNRRPRYRFCPDCINEMRTPFFPVHWRFNGWRLCPIHHLLLHAACKACEQPIILPKSMVTSGSQKRGVAYLSHCLNCEEKLGEMQALRFLPDASSIWTESGAYTGGKLSIWQSILAVNGRAILASLYFGRIDGAGDVIDHGLRWLAHLDSAGHLPHNEHQFGLEGVQRRLELIKLREIPDDKENGEFQTAAHAYIFDEVSMREWGRNGSVGNE